MSYIISKIVDFFNDFANASSRAQQLDLEVLQDAATISAQLGELVAFASAQVYSSILLTIAVDLYGHFNNSDAMAFMQSFSFPVLDRSHGQSDWVNSVDTLYLAFPALMYMDPKLGGLLLEPLFRLQASPKYTNPYAASDIGAS